MPVSLAEAYYEYRYDILAEQHLSLKEQNKIHYSESFIIISNISLGETTNGFLGKCFILPVIRQASLSFLFSIITS
ncbi:MAG: hypothetical protein ACOX1F_07815 [Erysipelotrichaceae bacterium]